MSEFKVGDRVVVKDGVPYTKLHGCEGKVTGLAIGGDGCFVDFGDQYSDILFKDDELIKINPKPRFFKTGDKVRVKPDVTDDGVSVLPTGTLEVTRDQTQADIYVQVRKWNGHFWEGYGINAGDLELVKETSVAPPTAPEAAPVDEPEPAAFKVGDWVKLKPGNPWEGDVWARLPGEIIDHRQGDPGWYEVRFCDGGSGWHTASELDLVSPPVPDELDDPQPPDDAWWYVVQAPQYDGSMMQIAVTPYYDQGCFARLWLRSYDLTDPDDPFVQWCVELNASDVWKLSNLIMLGE